MESDIKLVVDTGAVLTAVPKEILESLGIKPIGKRKLRVFGGHVIERDVSAALIKYSEAQAGVTIVFAEARIPCSWSHGLRGIRFSG